MDVFGAAFTRLANTNGTMLIETPPRRPSGMIYEIYEMSKMNRYLDQVRSIPLMVMELELIRHK